MIQTYAHEKKLHEARIDIKTLERLFANLITEDTNCSPFESDIIVEKAKEVLAMGDHARQSISTSLPENRFKFVNFGATRF